MKSKILNLLLVLTSFAGYLEYGKDSRFFFIQAEAEIFEKLFSNPLSVAHPFVVLPLVGQILLLFTLFQKIPSRRITLIGFWLLAILLGFVFVIGVMGLNAKITLSVVPFWIVGMVMLFYRPKQQVVNQSLKTIGRLK